MNASGVLFNNSEDTNDVKPPVTPLKPDPKLAPPKRPQKLFFNNPLSPIASSPENSPPGSPKLSRPKNLQIPTFLAKFNSSKDLNSSGISKMSRWVLQGISLQTEKSNLSLREGRKEIIITDILFFYGS